MKIKNLICTLVALIGFQLVSFAASTTPLPVVPNELTIEKIAAHFAAAPMDYGYGWYYFNAVSNGVSKEMNASFTLQRKGNRWGITQLAWGGKELPIDPNYPLWEFPPYTAGAVENFQLQIDGYDKSGKQTRRGSFYKDGFLLAGDEIKINLYLSYVQAKVPFTFTGDHNANNTGIQDQDGSYGGSYDANSGSFIVSYDPLYPPSSWVIFDRRNNSVIGTAPFKGPSTGTPVPDSGTGFALNLPERISEISLNRDGWSEGLEGLKMEHKVNRGGTNYSAKVVAITPRTASDYVLVYGYGLRVGSILEVRGVNTDGSTKLLGTSVVKDQDNSVRVIDATGHVGYIATFIGTTTHPIQGFTTYTYSSSWPQGDNGGGKGRGKSTSNGGEVQAPTEGSSSSNASEL